MYDDMAQKMAELLTTYSQPIHPGNLVLIQGPYSTAPLMEALYESVLRKGGNPVINTGLPGLNELKLQLANEEQLKFIDPATRVYVEQADILFNIFATDNSKAMASIDPKRIALAQSYQREITEIYFRRIGEGTLRFCIFPWATQGSAQEAEMGIYAYRKFIYEGCGFHLDDPLVYWQEMHDRQQEIVDFLQSRPHKHVHVKGPGIELSFDYEGREWVNCDGHVNFPDGEVFTGPVEDSVNGYVHFNLRTVLGGREVNGVRFEYENGRIVKASAEKNEEYLLTQLDLDEGARRMGEFAIGTNWNIQDVTGSVLFDEKIGGTIHMAIGRSIPQSKGVNMSAIHWDMVHDMKDGGEIYVDDELFYQNGKFINL